MLLRASHAYNVTKSMRKGFGSHVSKVYSCYLFHFSYCVIFCVNIVIEGVTRSFHAYNVLKSKRKGNFFNPCTAKEDFSPPFIYYRVS